jgi:small-conductance mechanosensitive channel
MNAMLRGFLFAGVLALAGSLGLSGPDLSGLRLGGPAALAQGIPGVVPLPATAPAKPPLPAPAATSAPAATQPALSPAQARDILETLNDPKKRAALAATLEAISKALPEPPPPPPAQTPPAGAAAAAGTATAPAGAEPAADAAPAGAPELALPLKPDSLGARLLVTASDVLAQTSLKAEEAISAMSSLPALWHWVQVISTDPWSRGLLRDTSWRLLVVFAAGLLAEYAARLALRRPRAALEAIGARQAPHELEPADDTPPAPLPDAIDLEPDAAPQPPDRHRHLMLHGRQAGRAGGRGGWRVSTIGMLRRLPLTLGRLGLDLLPVVVFVLAAHLVLGTPIGQSIYPRLVMIGLIGAYAACGAILAVARSLFAPVASGLRLFDISDQTAAYLMRWTRRIVVVTVFGYAMGEAGQLLGLSDVAHQAVLKTVGLIDHVFVAIIVLQKRRPVRDWISAPPGQRGLWAQLRNRIAPIWHWIALFYIVALWVVWAVEVQNGFSTILRLFVLTATVMTLMRIVMIVLHGTLDRLITPSEDTLQRYPGIGARVRFWKPVLHMGVDAIVYLLTFVQLLQVWGLGAVNWLMRTDLGHHVLSALSSVLVTLAVAMLVWEAANHWAERHLARLARESQVARSARLRTLLPMLRTMLMVAILTIVGLLVLSEIGVNTAPLLAGAGVLGIAIGFGSQKLVQDVITGLFLLLENTMQVGDVVSLGGMTGTVEELSVRAIRLRAEDGSVHMIPFSAVTTSTNMTRDFGHAVIEVGVAYKEDYDHVIAVMRGIVTEMRAEPRWEGEIRDELEVLGLNGFGDSAVMIKARIRCGPFGRWSVLREFNRRMKARFDQEGIEIPYPHQALVVNQPITVAGRPAVAGPLAPVPPAPQQQVAAR